MSTTILLYEDNAYVKEFTATVIACDQVKKGYEVVLDRTAFFPEGGGQGADRGILNDLEVVDVQEKTGVVRHLVNQPIEPGSRVSGQIDWRQRFSNMQQHTGEHIVSGLVNRTFGYQNVGFHLGTQEITLDFNGTFTPEQLNDIEARANETVWNNVPVRISYPDKETLKELVYRSKIEIEGQVRIVTIEGCDVCACCAPHVDRTGEIGSIKILDAQKYKGGTRMRILCGDRALDYYRTNQQNVHQISVLLSAKQDAVAGAVERLKDENEHLRSSLFTLQNDLIGQKLNVITSQDENIIWFEKDMEAGMMRKTVSLMMEKTDQYCAVFTGDDISGYRYIIGSSQQNMKKMMDQMKAQLQARGGGSGQMYQGFTPATRAAIEGLF